MIADVGCMSWGERESIDSQSKRESSAIRRLIGNFGRRVIQSASDKRTLGAYGEMP